LASGQPEQGVKAMRKDAFVIPLFTEPFLQPLQRATAPLL
jgi:hypothetical protein